MDFFKLVSIKNLLIFNRLKECVFAHPEQASSLSLKNVFAKTFTTLRETIAKTPKDGNINYGEIMSSIALSWAKAHRTIQALPLSIKCLLIELAERCNPCGITFVSHATLIKSLAVSQRTLSRYFKRLEAADLIKIVRRRRNHKLTSSVTILNMNKGFPFDEKRKYPHQNLEDNLVENALLYCFSPREIVFTHAPSIGEIFSKLHNESMKISGQSLSKINIESVDKSSQKILDMTKVATRNDKNGHQLKPGNPNVSKACEPILPPLLKTLLINNREVVKNTMSIKFNPVIKNDLSIVEKVRLDEIFSAHDEYSRINSPPFTPSKQKPWQKKEEINTSSLLRNWTIEGPPPDYLANSNENQNKAHDGTRKPPECWDKDALKKTIRENQERLERERLERKGIRQPKEIITRAN